MQTQVPKAKYSLFIEFQKENNAVVKTGLDEIHFKVSKKEFEDMVYYGYLPKPLMKENAVVYLFDEGEDHAEVLEEVIVLFAFKERIKEWEEFKKCADVIARLQYVPLLFWYSRVKEYRSKNQIDKVIRAFKELYL